MKAYDYFLTFVDLAFDIVVNHIVIALFGTPVHEFASHCHADVALAYSCSARQAIQPYMQNRAGISDKR